MATITFELEAEMRKDIGKGASRRLRRANQIPGIVYGAGEPSVSLTLNHDKVSVALTQEAFYSHILTLKLGRKREKVILKAIQRHPAQPRIQHIDFQRIKSDQKLHMHVPLHFIGSEKAPGLKEGGLLSHIMTDVEVVCLPANLPEHIEVDVSHLTLNQVIHLSELALPKGVELAALLHGVEGHDLPVASIHLPRIIEEPTETKEATPEDAKTSAEKTTEGSAESKAAGEDNK